MAPEEACRRYEALLGQLVKQATAQQQEIISLKKQLQNQHEQVQMSEGVTGEERSANGSPETNNNTSSSGSTSKEKSNSGSRHGAEPHESVSDVVERVAAAVAEEYLSASDAFLAECIARRLRRVTRQHVRNSLDRVITTELPSQQQRHQQATQQQQQGVMATHHGAAFAVPSSVRRECERQHRYFVTRTDGTATAAGVTVSDGSVSHEGGEQTVSDLTEFEASTVRNGGRDEEPERTKTSDLTALPSLDVSSIAASCDASVTQPYVAAAGTAPAPAADGSSTSSNHINSGSLDDRDAMAYLLDVFSGILDSSRKAAPSSALRQQQQQRSASASASEGGGTGRSTRKLFASGLSPSPFASRDNSQAAAAGLTHLSASSASSSVAARDGQGTPSSSSLLDGFLARDTREASEEVEYLIHLLSSSGRIHARQSAPAAHCD